MRLSQGVGAMTSTLKAEEVTSTGALALATVKVAHVSLAVCR
jgi:hypothetical protein